MWLVPAYRRVGPVVRGQHAISRTSKPAPAAQSATSMSGVAGNGAVRKPSFIAADPPGSTGATILGCPMIVDNRLWSVSRRRSRSRLLGTGAHRVRATSVSYTHLRAHETRH